MLLVHAVFICSENSLRALHLHGCRVLAESTEQELAFLSAISLSMNISSDILGKLCIQEESHQASVAQRIRKYSAGRDNTPSITKGGKHCCS